MGPWPRRSRSGIAGRQCTGRRSPGECRDPVPVRPFSASRCRGRQSLSLQALRCTPSPAGSGVAGTHPTSRACWLTMAVGRSSGPPSRRNSPGPQRTSTPSRPSYGRQSSKGDVRMCRSHPGNQLRKELRSCWPTAPPAAAGQFVEQQRDRRTTMRREGRDRRRLKQRD